MTATHADVVTVAELTEAECREVMAERARLTDTRQNRPIRAELLVEITALLDAYNTIVGQEP